MSRIGRKPITVPEAVTVELAPGRVAVKGPKGELSQALSAEMKVEQSDGVLTVERPTNRGEHRALHGLTRSLIANMVEGVTDGFEKRLLEERARVLKQLGYYEDAFKQGDQASDGDLSSYSFHMADQGTDSIEREKAFLAASAEGRNLIEVYEALRRLYTGDFGTCETCGEEIARKRLEAIPYTTLCLSCKQKEEKRAGRR